ncbi:MBL fold metallo-hydrolase [Parerythrobacter jejuensis]|uniref:MBL fold metallo-hydrolase n=1 Tax=Parerythrobacter jejuensis TaxID=795812 RepID=A0A845AT69_9SPHN|nr:MBL fold metallo-hydrolase [Parerythrobacter jejuensis]MXP32557.1 MBL fold metallo-hydrolase [Parerythrobacter jejuensis]
MFARRAFVALAFVALAGCHTASGGTAVPLDLDTMEEFAASCEPWDTWSKPGPIFAVDDDVYGGTRYVGSCGITMLAVHTDDGVVLLDTGEAQFHDQLITNLGRAGIKPADVKYILTSHEHYDHVGGLAAMQNATGARIVTSEPAKPVIESGKLATDDPQSGMHDPMEPARVWQTVGDGETLDLDGKSFMAIAVPGHTPGALAWQWETQIGSRRVTIVYADSLSPVSGDAYKFSANPDYVAQYRAGLERLRAADCDILLTPHPSASKMLERAASGSLVGGMTCTEYADSIEQRLDKRLAEEAE